MSHPYWVDQKQVQFTTGVGCVDTNGENQSTLEGAYIIPVIVTSAEAESLLAQYDPNSGTSPLVAVARPLARLILDALLRATSEESE